MNRSHMILHIATQTDWQKAQVRGEYRCASLTDEGFIHCSTREQLLIPANERFRGRLDLLLLCVDPSRLACELRFEDCYESGMEFPHIYGAIELAAVIDVLAFSPSASGLFEVPAAVAELP